MSSTLMRKTTICFDWPGGGPAQIHRFRPDVARNGINQRMGEVAD